MNRRVIADLLIFSMGLLFPMFFVAYNKDFYEIPNVKQIE